jgi:hypothetical protein
MTAPDNALVLEAGYRIRLVGWRKSMTKFFAGLTLGLFIGICVTSYAATIVGNTPTLEGWTVTYGDNTICTDPEVNFKDKEIECAGGDPRDPIDPR